MAFTTRTSGMSASVLLEIIAKEFEKIPDHRKYVGQFPLPDVLMSALAMFSLKCPSLLAFDEGRNDATLQYNLHSLFGVKQAPCDTQMRRTLDLVLPEALDPVFRAIHQHLKGLPDFEQFLFQEDTILIAADGTEYFSSKKIHCKECCRRTLKNGDVQYYHQALVASIVKPGHSLVLPVAVAPILRLVDADKNAAEIGTLRTLFEKIRGIYPTEKIIITLDGLFGKGPVLKLLKEFNFDYIIVVKETDHSALFEHVQQQMRAGQTTEFEVKSDTGEVHGYRFLNDVPINNSHPDIHVNYLDYWGTSKEGRDYQCLWITGIPLDRTSVYHVMRGGRCRWKIENETFNTLKNQGYELEHNYGHGEAHLSVVMMNLMLIAFLVDQAQEAGCSLFQAARRRFHSRRAVWERLRGLFHWHPVDGWDVLWLAIASMDIRVGNLVNDTS